MIAILKCTGREDVMKRVLVVDDTKNIRNLLKTCLEIEGYDVTAAIDGKQALDFVFQQSFELIFLDIKLPEVSGTEVLRRIRAEGINIPVVIMTAFATVKNAVDCTRLGAVAYLQKPFTADKVRALLDELISQSGNNTNNINVAINLGSKLINDGQYIEAYENLKQALAKDPSDFRIYELMGEAMKALNRDIEAKKYFEASRIFRQ